MGRKVRIIDAAVRNWYVPDIDDNREDPEPFRVLLSPISGKDMRALRSSLKLQATSLESEDLMQAAEQREEQLKAMIVAKHIHEVEGYSAVHVVTQEVVEPKDGETLVACILDSHPEELTVLNDIYEAIVESSSLSEEAKKKSNSQSSLQSPETTGVKHGDALSAEALLLPSKTTLGDNGIATALPTFAASVQTGSQS